MSAQRARSLFPTVAARLSNKAPSAHASKPLSPLLPPSRVTRPRIFRRLHIREAPWMSELYGTLCQTGRS